MAAVPLKCAYFTSVSDEALIALRGDPAKLAAFLKRNPGHGVAQYWHAIPYLINGIAKNIDEPYRWFVEGGETVGETEAGPVRYLDPKKVAKLATALREEEPDEIGMGNYDEAKMDRNGVYPERFVAYAEDFDPLGQLRELYSYLRTALGEWKKKKSGALVYMLHEGEVPPRAEPRPAPAAKTPEAPAPPAGEPILKGLKDRVYFATDAASNAAIPKEAIRKADGALASAGYRPVGDFKSNREEADDAIRGYVAEDGLSAAVAFLSSRGLGSFTFLSLLEDNSLVGASDAFMLPVKKTKFLGLSISRGDAPTLHASVVERREKAAKKSGPPVPVKPDLKSVVELWESLASRYA